MSSNNTIVGILCRFGNILLPSNLEFIFWVSNFFGTQLTKDSFKIYERDLHFKTGALKVSNLNCIWRIPT